MFSSPNDPVTIAALKQFTGPVEHVSIWHDLPDNDYHEKVPGFSSSTLKEYLKDPATAFKQKVTKQVEKKEPSEISKRAFRFGRAVHCLVLEGVEKFKMNFPVFGGARRAGKAWEEMKETHPKATEEDNILTTDEVLKVEALGEKVSEQYEAHLANVRSQGLRLFSKFNEISVAVLYKSGLAVKIRCDELLVWESPKNGTFMYEIMDLKTTERSVHSDVDLAFAMDDYGYDLSAVLYANTLYDALFGGVVPNIMPDGKTRIPLIPPGLQNAPVIFSLLWASKPTGLISVQSSLVQATQDASPGTLDWAGTGRTKFLLALHNYTEEAAKWIDEVAAAKSRTEALALKPTYVSPPLIKKQEYGLRDMLSLLQAKNRGPSFNAPSDPDALMGILNKKFGTEFPKTPAKTPPETEENTPIKTPPKEAATPNWSFKIPSATTQVSPAAPVKEGSIDWAGNNGNENDLALETAEEVGKVHAERVQEEERAEQEAVTLTPDERMMLLARAKVWLEDEMKKTRKKDKFLSLLSGPFMKEFPSVVLSINCSGLELPQIKNKIKKASPTDAFKLRGET